MNREAAQSAGSRFGSKPRSLAIGTHIRSFIGWLGSRLGRAPSPVATGGSLSLDPSQPLDHCYSKAVACWAGSVRTVEAESAGLDFADACAAARARVASVEQAILPRLVGLGLVVGGVFGRRLIDDCYHAFAVAGSGGLRVFQSVASS